MQKRSFMEESISPSSSPTGIPRTSGTCLSISFLVKRALLYSLSSLLSFIFIIFLLFLRPVIIFIFISSFVSSFLLRFASSPLHISLLCSFIHSLTWWQMIAGPGYVLSQDCARMLADTLDHPVPSLPVLPLEDVNTALIMEANHITPRPISEFLPGACPCSNGNFFSPRNFRFLGSRFFHQFLGFRFDLRVYDFFCRFLDFTIYDFTILRFSIFCFCFGVFC